MNASPDSPQAAAASESAVADPQNNATDSLSAIADFAAPLLAAQIAKAGYKTTEFWIMLLVIVAMFGLAFQNKLSPDMAAQLSAGLSFVWLLVRSLLKTLPKGASADAGANGGTAVIGCSAVPSLPAAATTRSAQA